VVDPRVEQDEHGTICRVFLSAQQRAGLGGVRDAISQFALLSDNNAISNQNIQPE
jgi:GTP-binding protein HflX